jgi:hypothetical protein
VAMELAGLVQQDGDPDSIGEFLGSLAAAELAALPIVLAGMVDLDQTPQELLSWVRWDEQGRVLPEDADLVLWSPKRRTEGSQAECGTTAGYAAHRAEDELPCDACRKAFNEYRRQWRGGKQREEGAA